MLISDPAHAHTYPATLVASSILLIAVPLIEAGCDRTVALTLLLSPTGMQHNDGSGWHWDAESGGEGLGRRSPRFPTSRRSGQFSVISIELCIENDERPV